MSPSRISTNRYHERGSVLVITMIALVALVSLGSLTIITVRSSVSSTTNDRFKAVALFAAEAGLSAAIQYARERVDPTHKWSAIVVPADQPLLDVPGNDVKPGQPGNIFDPETRAWYVVEFLNNRDDRGGDTDTDGRIIIRVTGHGPNNAAVGLEVEIAAKADSAVATNNMGSTNSGYMSGRVDDSESSMELGAALPN